MKVPFNNLNIIHNQIRTKVDHKFNKIIKENRYQLSDEIVKFE